jgi:hypothetical protein
MLIDIGLVDISKNDNVSLSPGYFALSSQLARIQPSSTTMADYEPTNTASAACRITATHTQMDSTGAILTHLREASTDLPHAPSAILCSCMMKTLGCTVHPEDVHNITVMEKFCNGTDNNGPGFACRGVKNSIDTGQFGAYAGCNESEVASWIINQIFLSRDKDPAFCSSEGGTTQVPVPSKSQLPDCETLLQQVGPDATGRVTLTPRPAPKEIDHKENGLGHSASIGLGIGTAVAIIACIFAIVWFFVLRRRIKRKAMVEETEVFQKSELPATSLDVTAFAAQAVELDGVQRNELEGITAQELGGTDMIEAPSDSQIHELNAVKEE